MVVVHACACQGREKGLATCTLPARAHRHTRLEQAPLGTLTRAGPNSAPPSSHPFVGSIQGNRDSPSQPRTRATAQLPPVQVLLLAASGACRWVGAFTRFSGELFGGLIGVLFLQQAIKVGRGGRRGGEEWGGEGRGGEGGGRGRNESKSARSGWVQERVDRADIESSIDEHKTLGRSPLEGCMVGDVGHRTQARMAPAALYCARYTPPPRPFTS